MSTDPLQAAYARLGITKNERVSPQKEKEFNAICQNTRLPDGILLGDMDKDGYVTAKELTHALKAARREYSIAAARSDYNWSGGKLDYYHKFPGAKEAEANAEAEAQKASYYRSSVYAFIEGLGDYMCWSKPKNSGK